MVDITTKMQEKAVEWEKAQDVSYRRSKMCDLQWLTYILGSDRINSEFEISNTLVACAKNGGPIALLNKHDNLLAGSTHLLKNHLGIFNACGGKMNTVQWTEKDPVLCFEYTADEMLVIVTEKGQVYVMKPREEQTPIIKSILELCGEGNKLIGAKIHENSLVVVTSKNAVYLFSDLIKMEPKLLCQVYSPTIVVNPQPLPFIMVIDSRYSASGFLEVLIPHEESGFFRITELSPDALQVEALSSGSSTVPIGTVVRMAQSHGKFGDEKKKKGDDQFLAIFLKDQSYIITSCNLESKKVIKRKTAAQVPDKLLWCGSGLALCNQDSITLLAPNDENCTIQFDSPGGYYCSSECDGIRTLTQNHCYFIEAVPDAVKKAYAAGSLDPATYILQAYQKYLQADPKAEETLKGVEEDKKGNLGAAVKTLIEAATCEFDAEIQKHLLKAASFAKNFIPPGEFDAENFVETLKHLRIVNQLHVPKYGRMITFGQYKRMKTKQFIKLLLRYQYHFLAFVICKYIGFEDNSIIYEDWAIKKLRFGKSADEAVLYDEIKNKLSECRNLGYTKIVLAAQQEDKKGIALKLLENTESIKDQVPILLTMKEYDTALRKAVSANEMDIVYGVFSVMMKSESTPDQLVKVALNAENGLTYLISYAQQRKLFNSEDQLLKNVYDLLERDPRTQPLGIIEMKSVDMISSAIHQSHIKDLKIQAAQFSNYGGKAMLQHQKILMDQYMGFILHKANMLKGHKKHDEFGNEFFLSDALFPALSGLYAKAGAMAAGDAMAKKLNVDKRYLFLIKLRALAKVGDWNSFMELIKKEKQKIKPEVFAEICLEFGKKELAVTYIRQMSNVEEKVQKLEECECLKDAIEEAVMAKRNDLLKDLKDRARIDIDQFINEAMQKMKK